MSDHEVRDTRVPTSFEIEQLLSEVRSFEHEPSLERICNAQPVEQPDKVISRALSVEPASLCFEFAHKSRTAITRTLRVHNLRGQKVKMYFTPPKTKYFTLRGDHVVYVYPGLPLNIEVTFEPCEPRAYNDEILVTSPGEPVIVVDLEAEPRCHYLDFPARIDFGTVPLGSRVERSLLIQPCGEHDVKFTVLRNKWDCDLLVGPLWGVVRPCDEPRRVRIVFEPSAYVTALYELQVFVPSASLTPFRVAIAAVCVPALSRDRLLRALPAVQERPNKATKQRSKFTKTTSIVRPKPATPTTTCQHDAHIQLGPFGLSLEQERAAYLGQCEQFIHAAAALREDAWRVRVCDEIVRLGAAVTTAAKGRASIDLKLLSIQQAKPSAEDLYMTRETPRFLCQRTLRKYTQDEEKAARGSSSYGNADFFVRYQILCKLIAAARRVVTTNRHVKRLQLLKENAAATIATEEAADAIANTTVPPPIDEGTPIKQGDAV